MSQEFIKYVQRSFLIRISGREIFIVLFISKELVPLLSGVD